MLDAIKDQVFSRERFLHGHIVRFNGTKVTLTPAFSGYEPEDVLHLELKAVGIAVVTQINGAYYHLLVQQADREGFPWEIPSGGIDGNDEFLLDAPLRELQEETGLTCFKQDLRPMNCIARNGKVYLQYSIEVSIDLNEYEVVSQTPDHIYVKAPNGVDPNEIMSMCWERLGVTDTLLRTSGHIWAYENYFRKVKYRYLEGT
jgi:8-oxo-dGTP pyrophosphatase MutT (NUDIX family)